MVADNDTKNDDCRENQQVKADQGQARELQQIGAQRVGRYLPALVGAGLVGHRVCR